ncbi:MAG: PAS domain-containing protein [Armatimonadetes bacterium]|nr:PAS domain-containing protein [Armatimonadota bacterium]
MSKRLSEAEGAGNADRRAFNALMEACGTAVLAIDKNGVIAMANSNAAKFNETSASELVGKPLIRVTLSADIEQLVRSAIEGGEMRSRTVRFRGPEGRFLRVTARPLTNDGVHEGTLIVAQDVTTLRRLQIVRQDFVANVSHELRTPLASIRAMAETLQDGRGMEERISRSFLETIISEVDRLTRIANDLLTLSEAESRPSAKAGFDFSKLTESVITRFQGPAKRAGITIRANIEPEITVIAAQDQMEQVLVNLIDNAIKYNSIDGSVDVGLRGSPGSIHLTVSDTGVGIAQEHLPRIFERFYRVDRARSRQSGGTGLGLSIVKHIVEAHDGSITANSDFNRGSTFKIDLPTGSADIKERVDAANQNTV